MNTCPNCGLTRGLHSSILPGCMCQYEVQLPQKKEWVGLTDEEIKACAKGGRSIGVSFHDAICRAEAKLKEKNT